MSHKSGLIRSHISRLITLLVGLLIAACLPSHSYAQSIQGSINGTVRDSGGAVIPGATVTLTNVGEGTSRTMVTDGSGNYEFVDSKAGQYSVQVTANGFQKWSATGLVLN